MSDIATEVGLTRPAMYYYFRTKERLFQAVFGDILMSFLPKVSSIITSDVPLEEKIGAIADVPNEGSDEGFRRIRADGAGNQCRQGRKYSLQCDRIGNGGRKDPEGPFHRDLLYLLWSDFGPVPYYAGCIADIWRKADHTAAE